MTKELVISSYKEDTSWIDNINKDVKIYLYNKDNKPNTINLPNIGREAHTYLYHICNNYDNLSDYIFFFQGNPFDHTGMCINIINGNEKDWNNNVQMHFDGYWGYAHNSLGTMWKLDTSIQFEGECLSCRNDGYPHCNEFPGGILPIKEIWNQIFEVPIPDMLEFIPGCQFHIHKNLIYNKSLILWEKLYNMSENMQYFPWMFERIVPYILNNNFKIKQ
jgi:hypothetical protein